MSVKLLTEHLLEVLSFKRGYTGLSESTLVKLSNYWKSRATAQVYMSIQLKQWYEVRRAKLVLSACADPDSFVRGGPNLKTFYLFL